MRILQHSPNRVADKFIALAAGAFNITFFVVWFSVPLAVTTMSLFCVAYLIGLTVHHRAPLTLAASRV